MHRILVIGVGSIGERHLRCFINTNRAECGICELNNEIRDSISARYKVQESFDSLKNALKNKWDAAVIATPAHTHISIALQLAAAGVSLFIEKPLSTTLKGLKELIELTEESRMVVAVAYIYRAHPGIAAMRQAIQGGRFGRPVQIISASGCNFPFNRPAYRDIYYADRGQGGGAIQDALTHIVNTAEWLVGPIDKLAADAAHQVLDGVEVEDTVNMICRHGDVMGSYSLNQYQDPNEMSITVVCQKGTLRFELHENRWRWITDPTGTWHNEEIPHMERDDWFVIQANTFLDSLEGKSLPLCTLREGCQTLKVNLAALASANEGACWKNVQTMFCTD